MAYACVGLSGRTLQLRRWIRADPSAKIDKGWVHIRLWLLRSHILRVNLIFLHGPGLPTYIGFMYLNRSLNQSGNTTRLLTTTAPAAALGIGVAK